MTHAHRPPESFLAGRESYFIDRKITDNPKPKSSKYHKQWNEGFNSATSPPAMDIRLQDKISDHATTIAKDANGGSEKAKLTISLHERAVMIDATKDNVEELRTAFEFWLKSPSVNRKNA
jgi:hypothetical protein